MINKITFIVLIFLAQSKSYSSEIHFFANSYMNSCGYYSNTSADFKINYKNLDLKWGTKVFLVSALSGTQGNNEKVEWQVKQEVEMQASAPFQWSNEFKRIVHERTSSPNYNQLVFILKLVQPNGEINYDTGSNKAWSFYAVNIPKDYIKCITSIADVPELTEQPVLRIQRN